MPGLATAVTIAEMLQDALIVIDNTVVMIAGIRMQSVINAAKRDTFTVLAEERPSKVR